MMNYVQIDNFIKTVGLSSQSQIPSKNHLINQDIVVLGASPIGETFDEETQSDANVFHHIDVIGTKTEQKNMNPDQLNGYKDSNLNQCYAEGFIFEEIQEYTIESQDIGIESELTRNGYHQNSICEAESVLDSTMLEQLTPNSEPTMNGYHEDKKIKSERSEHSTISESYLMMKIQEHPTNIHSFNQWKLEMFNLLEQLAEQKRPSAVEQDHSEHTSLDPTDWSSARFLAHKVLDAALDNIEYVRNRPVWQTVPEHVREAIENEPLPNQGQSLEKVCSDSLNLIMPYPLGNVHPRFWGWATGEGTVGGIVADILATSMNVNNVGGMHSAVFVEKTVIAWMLKIFGFPNDETSSGLIVSGTTMATIVALAGARQFILACTKKEGISQKPRLTVYVSTQAHSSVVKAVELLGLGTNAIRFISVDEKFQINIDELKVTICADREQGFIPVCIIGNAGTVNTGAFDDLNELANIAHSEKIWLHIDGAFGSLIILDPKRRHLVSGIEKADSLAFDFHKWLHCPYDAGCVLVRQKSVIEHVFNTHQSYLLVTERTCAAGNTWFNDLGPELSRRFRALKVWFNLKEHGLVRLGEKISENCDQAQYFVDMLEKHPDINIMRPVSLNIVNFRFESKMMNETDQKEINAFNNDLVADMQSSGVAVPSTTFIGEKLYIRVAIISHRTTLEDFHIFFDKILMFYEERIQKMCTKPK